MVETKPLDKPTGTSKPPVDTSKDGAGGTVSKPADKVQQSTALAAAIPASSEAVGAVVRKNSADAKLSRLSGKQINRDHERTDIATGPRTD